ncbi:hypothetical protein D8M03_02030 [Lysinibacillus endophyticus]|uniref:Uncharacterized protein n=1 Tax=Ureibacillus endophyticus TaxID=1978490 RepID=A0A494ZB08_9BACL|nr:hypothetical protein D8M03_02030 [Lysinibacillus endophyticus]
MVKKTNQMSQYPICKKYKMNHNFKYLFCYTSFKFFIHINQFVHFYVMFYKKKATQTFVFDMIIKNTSKMLAGGGIECSKIYLESPKKKRNL